jgi:two-component system, NtrC family, sensor kinase
MSELRRLIVRHRHVAPMVSALLAGVDAAITIRDADGEVVIERGAADGSHALAGEGRHEVAVEGEVLGWVEGGRPARGVAAVLAYAAARERDKRSLANEALERYRELSLIYDLAAVIGGHDDLEPIVETSVAELSRLPHDARGFLLLADQGILRPAPGALGEGGPVTEARLGIGIVGTVAASGVAELVDDATADDRATADERAGGSVVAVPLRSGDRTIGVVGATAADGPFRAADLKVVTAIAALAGPAIGRALGMAGGTGEARGTGEAGTPIEDPATGSGR